MTDVTIDHRLSTGDGEAILDVPGIRFGAGPAARRADPPDRRRHRAWSTARCQRAGADRLERQRQGHLDRRFHAPTTWTSPRRSARSPGMSGTIHFTDLLGLETAPGQTLTLEGDQPRHPRREWRASVTSCCPTSWSRSSAANGRSWAARLILQETILNFGRPSRQAADVRGGRARRQDLRRKPRASRRSPPPARSTACCR